MSLVIRTLKLALVLLCAALPLALSAVRADAASYQLTIETTQVQVDGQQAEKLAINGQILGPTLHLKEGEDAEIIVTNKTNEPTSVHRHGIMYVDLVWTRNLGETSSRVRAAGEEPEETTLRFGIRSWF